MNKDVVYIEPEDDITDIIEKVKQAEKKVVALVPPKKVGIMRSAVNTKLLAKAAKTSGKIAVVITTDASLIKLSAAAGLPIASSLQSRPKLPEEINTGDLENAQEPIAIDGRDLKTPEKKTEDKARSAKEESMKQQPSQKKPAKSIDEEINSVELENEAKKPKKSKDGKAGKKIPDMDKTRKWIIIGVAAGILLIVFLVWAIVFAPAATITVAIRTTDNNFAEDVSFVTSESKASNDSGVFYLESATDEKSASVDFTATGERDEGTKATGTLNLTATFDETDFDAASDGETPTITVPAGSKFAYNNLNYVIDSTVTFKLDDEEIDNCPSRKLRGSWSCTISATRSATAEENGDKYNIGQTGMNFTTGISGVTATNSANFSGGTSKTVKYIQESDVNAAKVKLTQQELETVTADDLKKEFGDDYLVIESSFAKDEGNVEVSPKVGEAVSDGTTPKVSVKTKYSVSAVKKESLIAFITKKTEGSLAEDQRMYDTGTPFIERFTNNSGTATGKLKTTTKSGPRVDENDIMEKSKGKSKEEVRSLLKSINGVSSVNVQTSFFWVGTVPEDENKVTINLGVEE